MPLVEQLNEIVDVLYNALVPAWGITFLMMTLYLLLSDSDLILPYLVLEVLLFAVINLDAVREQKRGKRYKW